MSIRNFVFVLAATLGWSNLAHGVSDANQPDEKTTGGICDDCEARRALLEEWPMASRDRRRQIVTQLTELNGGKTPDLPSAESSK